MMKIFIFKQTFLFPLLINFYFFFYQKKVTTKESNEEALINKKLPKELLLKIFSYLEVLELCRCAQVSKVSIIIMNFFHFEILKN